MSAYFLLTGVPQPREALQLEPGVVIHPVPTDFSPTRYLSGLDRGPEGQIAWITATLAASQAYLEVRPEARSWVARTLRDRTLSTEDVATLVLYVLQLAGWYEARSPLRMDASLHAGPDAGGEPRTPPQPWRPEGSPARTGKLRAPPERPLLARDVAGQLARMVKLLASHDDLWFILETYDQHRFVHLDRFALPAIWGALEQLLNPGRYTDLLSMRLPLAAVRFLGVPRPTRRVRIDEMRRLYDVRSRVVHGDPDELRRTSGIHVDTARSYEIFHEVLGRAVETGELPPACPNLLDLALDA